MQLKCQFISQITKSIRIKEFNHSIIYVNLLFNPYLGHFGNRARRHSGQKNQTHLMTLYLKIFNLVFFSEKAQVPFFSIVSCFGKKCVVYPCITLLRLHNCFMKRAAKKGFVIKVI